MHAARPLPPPPTSISVPPPPPCPTTQTILFVCIAYPMIGFITSASHFFFYLLITFMSITFYTTMGQALTYATPSQQLGQVGCGCRV